MIFEKIFELHVHIEGCVWPSHIRRWWSKSEFLFPQPSYVYSDNFERFLAHLRFGYNFLNSPEAYAWVVKDYVVNAIKNGIYYSELQINYALLKTWNMRIEDVLNAIQEKIYDIYDAPILRFIIDLPWQFSPNLLEEVISRYSELKKLNVVGISFGGDERFANPKTFVKIVKQAKNVGLKVICHAGEITDFSFAKEIIQEIKPERIAHAISLASWIEELGEKAPGIDVCLSSNHLLGIIQSFSEHPLMRWIKAGVNLSLSTDDPAIFQASLQDEYSIASQNFSDFNRYIPTLLKRHHNLALDKKAIKKAFEKTYFQNKSDHNRRCVIKSV